MVKLIVGGALFARVEELVLIYNAEAGSRSNLAEEHTSYNLVSYFPFNLKGASLETAAL